MPNINMGLPFIFEWPVKISPIIKNTERIKDTNTEVLPISVGLKSREYFFEKRIYKNQESIAINIHKLPNRLPLIV